ncbi:carbohydrate-binding protein [Flammeovirga yaeyamensis]|uniref:cellulase n=1 Tax=Flammeovirga yaeyamensis TaxID=367791 RepID=A0AAX1NEV1_9BACT|nr:glycosyl hydrolase family 8 [Flammeovirga yaeyamensis]MBB3701359.1 endo-1,4-beta-D-glucanase Y [Flammeovirga yaeyamensis]NMF38573.1 carbohydrate-binding protein [Flammeovirga yaeyamensis]QWG04463.1 carbohydrate-binding protein [Flammeovirga yaeyamensis]
MKNYLNEKVNFRNNHVKPPSFVKTIALLFISLLFFRVDCNAVISNSGITIQTETMTLGGAYAGTTTTPFDGIILYANDDNGSTTIQLSNAPGVFDISLRGASTNASAAGVSLEIDGTEITTFSFSGTVPSIDTKSIKIEGNAGSKVIRLVLKTDNGSNDTLLDWISFTRTGDIPPPPAPPTLPSEGAFYTGNYRNMFKEAGYTQQQIDDKINSVYQQLFYGDNDTERVYYPKGTDEGYILDIDNNDVRSEGMSYGMMIAVQMNKQEEFDRIWKFAKTHMQHGPGNREGYFRWIVDANGAELDPNTASDGEIYFITALYFASVRFGDRGGIYNYRAEADYILEQIMNKGWPHNQIIGSVPNMFNEEKKVCFVPYAQASTYTDPSYFLPSFYEVWGMMAKTNRQYWKDAAVVARDFFQAAAHPTTGLMPDYSNYDGSPTGGHKEDFVVDAWRCAMNVAMDYAWFKKDEREKTITDNIQDFFYNEGIYSYSSGYTLDGNPLPGTDYQAVGLVACNAMTSLASTDAKSWEFINALWDRAPTTGRYRYYDGLLQMMCLLHLSGNFKAYVDGSTPPVDPNPIPVTGITLTPSSLSLVVGQTSNLSVSISPSNADDKRVNYTSSNTNIATVSTLGVVQAIQEGSTTITATTVDGGFTDETIITVSSPPTSGQTPYLGSPQIIPGTINPVTFDNGGQDVAYNDSDVDNNGNGDRQDTDVDTENRTNGGNIGWIAAGEWLEYTVDINTTANYTLSAEVASPSSDGKFHIEFNGVDKTGIINVSSTGGWGTFTNVTASNVSLTAGEQVMRIVFDEGGFNLGNLSFTEDNSNGGGDNGGDNGGNTGTCSFGLPSSEAFPTTNTSFTHAHVLGNGPDLSHVNNISVNWSKEGGQIWDFSMRTNNGVPNWYVDLKTAITHTLGSASPSITFSNSGFSGLDGAYWIGKEGSDVVLVSKTSDFTIYLSNSSSAPSCSNARLMTVNSTSNSDLENEIQLYPNPATDQVSIKGLKSTTTKIKIYTISGVLVSTSILNEDERKLNVSALKKGTYVLQLLSDDDYQIKKLMIQ